MQGTYTRERETDRQTEGGGREIETDIQTESDKQTDRQTVFRG